MREMKDSGIDIVGNIPFSWKTKKLKYLCTVETGDQDTQDANPDAEYPFYVRSPIVERSDRYTFNGEGILMAGDGAGAGRIFHRAFGKYAVHQRVYRLANFIDIHTSFLYYYFSNLFAVQMDKGSAQSTVPSVRLPMLTDFNICIPTSVEQQAITTFLDSKCTVINSLTADIQTQIDILEQYKRSVITEAVTKGLNSEVEMKNSGLDWIGTVPKHWKIEKFKFHLKRNEPKNPGNTVVLSLYREYGVIQKDSRDDNFNKTSEDTSNYKHVRVGNFVVNKMKAWQGSVGISEYEGIISPAYFVYEFLNNIIYKRYFHFLLRGCYKDEFMRLSGGVRVGQWDLSAEGLANVPILIPPYEEQCDIANYINKKTREIELIISDKQYQLETLANYKKSLIYEYVTGKKEVPL